LISTPRFIAHLLLCCSNLHQFTRNLTVEPQNASFLFFSFFILLFILFYFIYFFMLHFEPSESIFVGDAGPSNTVEVAALRAGSFEYTGAEAGRAKEPGYEAQRRCSTEQKLEQAWQEGYYSLTFSTHGVFFLALNCFLTSWTIFSRHAIQPSTGLHSSVVIVMLFNHPTTVESSLGCFQLIWIILYATRM
jgi:hypothetical protein